MSPWHPHSLWTDERVERLRQLWCVEGWSAGVIAAELGHGISRVAVVGKARRMGLPRRRVRVKFKNPGSFALRQPPRTAGRKEAETPAPLSPGPHRLSIDQLTVHTCRWPYGNPAAPDFGYCGKFKEASGRPYCEHHTLRAYKEIPMKRERRLVAQLLSPTTDVWA